MRPCPRGVQSADVNCAAIWVVLAIVWVSPASTTYGRWKTVDLISSEAGGVLRRGSCGYGDISGQRWPYGLAASISGGPAFQGLVAGLGGCGACLEVRCDRSRVQSYSTTTSQGTWLRCGSNNTAVVQILDVCTDCPADSLKVSPQAATILGLSWSNGATRVPAEFRQVDCRPPGNITVRVDGYKPDNSWLRFELLDVAGGGAPSSVQIRESQQGRAQQWRCMSNYYGSAWEILNPPPPPVDILVTSAVGDQVIVIWSMFSRPGQLGEYPTQVQFIEGELLHELKPCYSEVNALQAAPVLWKWDAARCSQQVTPTPAPAQAGAPGGGQSTGPSPTEAPNTFPLVETSYPAISPGILSGFPQPPEALKTQGARFFASPFTSVSGLRQASSLVTPTPSGAGGTPDLGSPPSLGPPPPGPPVPLPEDSTVGATIPSSPIGPASVMPSLAGISPESVETIPRVPAPVGLGGGTAPSELLGSSSLGTSRRASPADGGPAAWLLPASQNPLPAPHPSPANAAVAIGPLGTPSWLGPRAAPAPRPSASPSTAATSPMAPALPSTALPVALPAQSKFPTARSSISTKLAGTVDFHSTAPVPTQGSTARLWPSLTPAPPPLPLQGTAQFLMVNQTEGVPLELVTELGLPLCVPARLGNTTVCIPVTGPSAEESGASAFNTSAGIAIATEQPLTLVPLADLATAPLLLPNTTKLEWWCRLSFSDIQQHVGLYFFERDGQDALGAQLDAVGPTHACYWHGPDPATQVTLEDNGIEVLAPTQRRHLKHPGP
eukprot:jgi/Botrbrau1/338/Bobra.0022s0292.1